MQLKILILFQQNLTKMPLILLKLMLNKNKKTKQKR